MKKFIFIIGLGIWWGLFGTTGGINIKLNISGVAMNILLIGILLLVYWYEWKNDLSIPASRRRRRKGKVVMQQEFENTQIDINLIQKLKNK